MACGIYKITNQVNGKVYIGQSKRIEQRWEEHKISSHNKNSNEYNYPLYQAFRKYGLENFKFEILEECLPKELNQKEIDYIALYESYPVDHGKGYNQTPGGNQGYCIKLTDNIINNVLQDLKYNSLTQLQIAEKYHLDKMTIHNINYGKENYFQENLNYPIRERKHKQIFYCKKCGVQISYRSNLCTKCMGTTLKVPLPPKEDLLKDLYEMRKDYLVAKKYGISTMLLKRWKEELEIPRNHKLAYQLYMDQAQIAPIPRIYGKQCGQIVQIDPNTDEILNIFESAADACRQMNKDENSTEPIRKCAKGLLEKAYGYKWKYLNNL